MRPDWPLGTPLWSRLTGGQWVHGVLTEEPFCLTGSEHLEPEHVHWWFFIHAQGEPYLCHHGATYTEEEYAALCLAQ